MADLWTGITTVITNVITLMGTVTTGLLANEIFQIVIGVVIFGLIMGIVFALVRKLNFNKNKDEWIGVFDEKKKHKQNKKKFYMINEDVENDFEYEMRALFDNDDDEFY